MLLSLGAAERERERERERESERERERIMKEWLVFSIVDHCYSKVEHSQYSTIIFANIK